MYGTQTTLFRDKFLVAEGREMEPVWVMARPDPSPIRTESSQSTCCEDHLLGDVFPLNP